MITKYNRIITPYSFKNFSINIPLSKSILPRTFVCVNAFVNNCLTFYIGYVIMILGSEIYGYKKETN